MKLVHHLYPSASAHSRELFNVHSDVLAGYEELKLLNDNQTGNNILISAIQMGLENDYDGLKVLSTQFPLTCRVQPACRFLAGKAQYRLGYDLEAIYFWSNDDLLWSKLIGNVAMTPHSKEDLELLERYYKILQEIKPEEAVPQYMMGSIYRSHGRTEQALPFFQIAFTREPDNARYQCALGNALVVSRKDIPYGLQLCDLAMQQVPEDMWVHYQTARTFSFAGECAQAKKIYEDMTKTFPERSEPSIWLQSFQTGQIDYCQTFEVDR